MSTVFRIYVEKRPGFDVKARQLARELRTTLGLEALTGVRLVNRYDVEGVSEEVFRQCVPVVFSEPQVDAASGELDVRDGEKVFAVEYLPGQFDQRADSASECVQLITQGERPAVRSATVYLLEGDLSDADVEAVKHYVINPVEAREASLELRETLAMEVARPESVEVLEGFGELDEAGLAAFIDERGLAMDEADIAFLQRYFRDEERRDPTITEVKVIDTYWSDHCRHTTFGTILDEVDIDDEVVKKAFDRYLDIRRELGRESKPVCLMDMGTIGAKHLKLTGEMTGVDESEEVNACTVRVPVDVDGEQQEWLFLFKNETHNHPTEIEPFGGAATCVGGAIRDPLSGRSYVYQAMRVTGAADPTVPVSETLPGKLPQRKIVTEAAAGYSSYGNQIGLATGQVSELYHPGYVAKRMEIGAVVGAAPVENVRREVPAAGDAVVLLGGRTGRDGIGGATGSSKAQNTASVEECGAEVQKGNAPVERKLQRLFRRGEACRLIKRCNDFGAGGVSVAIGELADGVSVNLDVVPKKYDGLDGTELAIAESQERMACVLAAADVDEFLRYAKEENLEATVVAEVTAEPRMRMTWRGDTIVDLSREFLASNGAPKHERAHIEAARGYEVPAAWREGELDARLKALVCDLNVASNKGLSERFDSTIGAATVLMPFGGANQLTPAEAMAAKFPVDGETTTASGMAWGFNPYISECDPYAGAYLAVVESVSRLYAAGFAKTKDRGVYLTLQEYFGKLRHDPARWGLPAAAVLGALSAQLDLGFGAIGGKDSMSGSFEDKDVPPTLVSFAVGTADASRAVSPEFKRSGDRLVWLRPHYRTEETGSMSLVPEAQSMRALLSCVADLTEKGEAAAIACPGYGCAAESIFKMCVGNRIGAALADGVTVDDLFVPVYGSFIVELDGAAPVADGFDVIDLGVTTESYELSIGGDTVDLAGIQEVWEGAIEGVFPYRTADAELESQSIETVSWSEKLPLVYDGQIAHPRVIIPVFPGTNCEYDTARAFRRAGAVPRVLVVNNLDPDAVAESARELASAIRESQIIMIPGGFSGGDEPDGSAKFITSFFRAPEVTEAVRDLLQVRDGLMLGICNGFQALVKLGLVPFGDIVDATADAPTLTFNTIGRHQSRLVRTRVASTLSPWLSHCNVGDVHTVAISHGEGRFVAPANLLASMAADGRIATQYCDAAGAVSMGLDVNPNGSLLAIEGATSPDGRVLGKMGHTERAGAGLYANIPDAAEQPLFQGGVDYFA